MKKNNIYVDVHVLQTVPPSCINRDDTGSPKTAMYGGVTRARVSSQAWKHAVREMFREEGYDDFIGNRTKKIVSMVMKELMQIDLSLSEAEGEKRAIDTLKRAGVKVKNAEKGTDALFFMSNAQARAIARLAAEKCKDNKMIKNALNENPSMDMVLFGRMVAGEDRSLNYDAAAQVAHSISTHAVHNEYDYYTAVDDCDAEDHIGAGHLGTTEFNSATFYRYATVNAVEVEKFAGVETGNVIKRFISAFIRSMPTGKQNTFANRTLPGMIYIAIRRDQPINLVGAFENAICNENGFLRPSEKRFCEYASSLYEAYNDKPDKAFGMGDEIRSIAEIKTFPEMMDELKLWLDANVSDE